MRKQSLLSLSVLTAAVALGALPADAQKSADTLRIGMRDAVTNIDPYYNALRTGLVMAHQGLGNAHLSRSSDL